MNKLVAIGGVTTALAGLALTLFASASLAAQALEIPNLDFASLCRSEERVSGIGLAASDWSGDPALLAPDQVYPTALALLSGSSALARDPVRAAALFAYVVERGGQHASAARVALATLLFSGDGIERDTERAIDLLRKAASERAAGAASRLAKLYEAGDLVERDLAMATRLLREAAAWGDANALVDLLRLERQGLTTLAEGRQTIINSLRVAIFESVAEADCAILKIVADSYLTGRAFEPDVTIAIRWYRAAAEGAVPAALFQLGRFYRRGQGVPLDTEKGWSLFREAAAQGYLNAAVALGRARVAGYRVGLDLEGAETYLLAGARSGLLPAMEGLVDLYGGIDGEMPQPEAAFAWVEKSAHHPDSGSMQLIRLARAFEGGKGTARDPRKAFEAYQAAAKAGSIDALLKLGAYYRAGEFVEADPGRAQRYYRQAALRGNRDAIRAMIARHRCGFVGDPDLEKEQLWVERAMAVQVLGEILAQIRLAQRDNDQVRLEIFVRFLRRAAKGGTKRAMAYLSRYFEIGLGVERDESWARKWRDLAVAPGPQQNEALLALAKVALSENGGGGDSDVAALLESLAKSGMPDAISAYADWIEENQPGKDHEVERLRREAAELGNLHARRKLATGALVQGGTEQGLTELLALAEKGDAASQLSLAEAYSRGVLADRPDAAKRAGHWFEALLQADSCDSSMLARMARLAVSGIAGGAYRDRADIWIAQAERLFWGNSKDARELAKYFWTVPKTGADSQLEQKAVQWAAEAFHRGDRGAARELARHYRNRGEFDRALTWFARGADSGDTASMTDQARLLRRLYRETGDDAYRASLLAAATAGQLAAQVEMGRLILDGATTEAQRGQAIDWLLRAMADGQSDAAGILVRFLDELHDRIGKDDMRRLVAAVESSAADKPSAMAALGEVFASDLLGPPDLEKAVRWSRGAAQAGHRGAMRRYGDLLRDGQGVGQDRAAAVGWYQRAADAGDTTAIGRLGDAYARGLGVEVDLDRAIQFYRQAADLGHRSSVLNLAKAYLDGDHVARDPVRGLRYLRKAADLGEPRAMLRLADMIALGQAGDGGAEAAARWIRRAADTGNRKAKLRLAAAYDVGFGVNRDPDRAGKLREEANE